jgi:Uma2 family endonuclease
MPQSRTWFTVDEYLKIERTSGERHIYVDGEIYAMAGESAEHGDISAIMVGILHGQLRGKRCRVRTKDSKVRSGPTPLPGSSRQAFFSYPDIVVICGEPEQHDAFQDVISNPKAIREVLSRETEAFDRGEKFTRIWSYHRHAGLDAFLVIDSIECTLKLADVYERVQFPQH